MADQSPIVRTEDLDTEVFEGTREALISAGLVRDDQFPPPGKFGISYLGVKVFRGRCRKDETYLRVEVHAETCVVRRGLPYEIGLARRRAANAQRRAEDHARSEEYRRQRNEKETEKEAASARAELGAIPISDIAFRRKTIQDVRWSISWNLQRAPEFQKHGYSIDATSIEAILISFDQVVEEIMRAKVNFDAAKHLSLVHSLHTKIARSDSALSSKVLQLTQPNPSILSGEKS